MTDVNLQSDPVFIDVATGTEVYTVNIVIPENPDEPPENVQIVRLKEGNKTKTEDSMSTLALLEIQPRRIRCTECSTYSAENEEKMLRHVRKVHRGENPFQCYMCDYSTYNKSLFEEHVRIHQGIKPFKCSHCPYRSASKKNTKKHELIHRPDNPHKCQHCGFIARHLKSLQCHINTAHIEMAGDFVQKGDLTPCPHCQRKYENLELHIKKRKQCLVCPMLLCSRRLLNRHMLTIHSDKKKLAKNDFVCAICNWSSNIRPKILLHLIHHPNQPVDEKVVDVNILKQCGIVGDGW